MPYDERLVAPMREEVRSMGVKELKTVPIERYTEAEVFFGS